MTIPATMDEWTKRNLPDTEKNTSAGPSVTASAQPSARSTTTGELSELIGRLKSAYYHDGHAKAVRDAIARLEEQERTMYDLGDTLRALHDEQNGPPLIRHEKTWRAAYERAGELLAEHNY